MNASFNKTTEVRAVIESLVGHNYSELYNDKRKNARRLKFFGMDLTNEQLASINAAIRKFNAIAEHYDAPVAGTRKYINSTVVHIKL